MTKEYENTKAITIAWSRQNLYFGLSNKPTHEYRVLFIVKIVWRIGLLGSFWTYGSSNFCH